MKRFLLMLLVVAPAVRADVRSKLAMEAAEAAVARFGIKVASKGLPALAARIEVQAAKYGAQTFKAVARVGPRAMELAEKAGVNGVRAMAVMAAHGEAGAASVLMRPAAMAQFLKHGEQAAVAMVRHPAIAERVIEKGGEAAVRAMTAVGPQSGRRIAMLMEGELAKSAKTPEMLDVIARYGERGASFVWDNKAALATGAAMTAFVANPRPFIEGAQDITKAAGENVLRPIAEVPGQAVKGVVAGTNWTVIILVLIAAAAAYWLARKRMGQKTDNTTKDGGGNGVIR